MLLRYKLYVEHQNARYKFYEMLGIEENATHEIISLAVTDLKMKIISKSWLCFSAIERISTTLFLCSGNEAGNRNASLDDVEKAEKVLKNKNLRALYDKGSTFVKLGEYFEHEYFFKCQPF